MTKIQKLVRDKIPLMLNRQPDIIEDDTRFKALLRQKMMEELLELQEATNLEALLEEVADLMDVVDEFLHMHGLCIREAADVSKHKREMRGGFANRYALTFEPAESVTDAKSPTKHQRKEADSRPNYYLTE
jgi:predicted house-cleaning noncanonical NTP pyrophosphatase (MazG superfamily)